MAAVPEGEEARFDLGPAVGLRGERRQTGVERSPDGTQVTERYQLRVENRTEEKVSVRFEEPLARSGRAVVVRSRPEAKRRDRELRFDLEVAPGATGVVELEVAYSW
jgi:hypothetical protein